jgi:hypothetical protein
MYDELAISIASFFILRIRLFRHGLMGRPFVFSKRLVVFTKTSIFS